MYPFADFLADFSFRPTWVPLVIYSLIESLLADVPFGRFSLRPTLGALIHIPSGRKTPSLIEKLLADVPFGRFLADFSFRPTWEPLVIYPLVENLLADVPFGRIFP